MAKPLPKEFCHLCSLPILFQTQKLSPMFQLLGSSFKSVTYLSPPLSLPSFSQPLSVEFWVSP